ncbi:MAG: hypothetical protein U0835_14705 [Isosphaeraceae bacterium]
MYQVVTQLTDLLGTQIEPSQKNLIALVVSTALYALFINRSK